jgi:hypothetical protein
VRNVKFESSSTKKFFSIIMSTDTSNNTDPHINREISSTSPKLAANAFLERYACYRATRPELLGSGRQSSFDTFFPASCVPVLDLLPLLLPNFGTTTTAFADTSRVPLHKLNILYQLRDNAKYRGVSHEDELLIELVALLFDRIFQDRQVPELIKRIMARLQIPLLKAVLVDRSLFVRPTHPARLLLNKIADTACGRADTSDAESDYCTLVNRVMGEIEQQFDEDGLCFSNALGHIENFHQKTWSREAVRHAHAAALLQSIEQREVANMQVFMHIRDAITGIDLDEGVAEFLLVPWRKVLVESQLKGSTSPTLSGLRQTVVDLVWSLQPKTSTMERQRMVQLLPELLKNLRNGLSSIDWPAESQGAFFTLLMGLHASAMHASMRTRKQKRAFQQFESRMLSRTSPIEADSEQPDFSTESVDISPMLLQATLRQQNLDLLVAQAPPKDSPASPLGLSPLEAGDAVAQIGVSTWIELRQESPAKMLKLHWISPLRTLFLFTDSSGQYAMVFTPAVLRTHLENNTASVMGKLSLSERVLASIEATMSRNWLTA